MRIALPCGLRTLALAAATAIVPMLGFAAAARAEEAWWHAQTNAFPAVIEPGHTAQVTMIAVNLGDAAISSKTSSVSLSDVLPRGLEATGIVRSSAGLFGSRGEVECGSSTFPTREVRCTWSGTEPLEPYEQLEVIVAVEAEAGASAGTTESTVTVAGGEAYRCVETGAGRGSFQRPSCVPSEEREASGDFEVEHTPAGSLPPASASKQITLGSGPAPFGIEEYTLSSEGEGGAPALQAGSHPLQVTSTLAFKQGPVPGEPRVLPKDVTFDWPAGLIGDPLSLKQCANSAFSTIGEETTNLCPPETAVGVASVDISLQGSRPVNYLVPVFNLTPERGEPARFGFEVARVPVTIDTAVRSGRDYGILASTHNISQLAGFVYARVTIWGTPGAQVHDKSRGWSCVRGQDYEGQPGCAGLDDRSPQPFLRLPSSCQGELGSSVTGDSWPTPEYGGASEPFAAVPAAFGSVLGCASVPFSAEVADSASNARASSPTGLLVKVHVSQEASQDPNGISDADLRDATVLFPEGLTANPSSANGLEGCTEAQVGYEGADPSTGLQDFSPGPGGCPSAAELGTVKVRTPILANALEGKIYLATPAPNGEPGMNPFNTLVALYIVAEDPVSGVRIKLAGQAKLDPNTGRIEASFRETPQAPFEELEVELLGGEQAALSTPPRCGSYQTSATFTPWSGNASITSLTSFEVLTGPNASARPGALLPFAPSLTAGTLNLQAAAFSALTTTVSREDGQQNIQSVQLHTPPGLSGLLSSVKLCGEAQADAGTCGPESEIGEATVSVGLGGDPFTVKGGRVYITGPYQGAPFGLSIVTPAVAGPFNLGNVLVRARIEVDPHTAALTVTTDETGPYAIPHILKGIPLQIQHINVVINRPGFTFNPTSCAPQSIASTIKSAEGATSTLAVPFQVANCANLKFAPKFQVSTPGHTTRADGAGLSVKLSYPAAAQGTQANIRAVKVDLPKQLPSRLTTLQKACTSKQFEANPAGCPKESKIGYATVTTPLLPVPLTGPAIFVSHGGEAFPSLTLVLQGYGVTIDLVGTTYINHAGITSSTFKTVPDVPFDTFNLTLDQGKYSALATNLPSKDHGNFCGQTLAMPTAFIAQNGAEIHGSTKIAVTGCPKLEKSGKKSKQRKSGKKK